MMQVISKTQGWITVTPQEKNRKRPIEKQRLGDAKKVNVLSPVWMQVEHERPPFDPLKPTSVKHGVRKEANRTFLVDKQQPIRSIFAGGSMRHNVHTKEAADFWMKQAMDNGKVTLKNANRVMEWHEPHMDRQGYDRAPISPKIGSAHFK